MNKIITRVSIILLCLLCQEVKSQGTAYVVENLKGKTVFQKNKASEWERAFNSQTLYGTYLLKVEKSVDLRRGKEIQHVARITSPVFVDSAWVHPHPKPHKYPSPDVIPMGEEKDSIGFCFITAEGDWRVDNFINKTDVFDAICLNHNSKDTLYAYAYWIFPDSQKRIPLSHKMDDEACVLKPFEETIIDLKEPLTLPLIENSNILICFSRDRLNEPKGTFNSINEFIELLREVFGFSTVTINIGLN